jgi:outer membrane cobalamin receptor
MIISYSHIDAINKSEEPNRNNKRIVFIPQHSLNTSLILNYHAAQITTVYRFVSERQVTAANTGVPLDTYRLVDLSAGYQINFNSVLMDFGFTVRNLFSENYELIRGYPMPGREFQFSLNLKYQAI